MENAAAEIDASYTGVSSQKSGQCRQRSLMLAAVIQEQHALQRCARRRGQNGIDNVECAIRPQDPHDLTRHQTNSLVV
jgi:hypothetical protein